MDFSNVRTSSKLIDTIIIANKTVCSTPGATLVTSFTVSSNLRSTEKLMVTMSVLMIILGSALFLLSLFGRFSSRKIHSTPMRIFFRASFALCLPFMSYMFSQAKSEGVIARADLILLWMLLMELLRKKVYAMVAPASDTFARGVGRFSFFDAVEQASRMVWIGYLIYAYVHGFGLKTCFIILWLFSVTKLIKRVFCIEKAKRSFAVGKNAHLIACYMKHLVETNQQVLQRGVPLLKTCNYVVMGEEKMESVENPCGYHLRDPAHPDADLVLSDDTQEPKNLVRVCTIWALAEEDLLFYYNRQCKWQLEDLCLEFSLFKLLRRRFENYSMAEVGTEQPRKLILEGLLCLDDNNENNGNNAERAFNVVC